MNQYLRTLIATMLLTTACSKSSTEPAAIAKAAPAATPRAVCGPGSRPETGLQGRVSPEDYSSGRAAKGFNCNTELVGKYDVPNALGTVGGFKVERYTDRAGNDCAYYDTTLTYPTNVFDNEAGVNVLDMNDPANPVLSERLLTPAMLSPHESLVVSQEVGILAAVTGNAATYPGIVDIYDLSDDCRHPVLKASAPVGFLGHESGLSPDGKTFYSASPGTYSILTIDISNPALPTPLAVLPYSSHGLSISADGNRAYLAGIGLSGVAVAYNVTNQVPDANNDNGMVILDVSEIQARKTNPQVREVSRLKWDTITVPQNAIPFTRNGKPYVLEIDEFTRFGKTGAARIIDIADERNPKVLSDIRLEVHNPENFEAISGDPGYDFIGQGYGAHYCNLPTRVDPDIVACSMILSGLRVFDIRDPAKPREVAYFTAPVYPRVTPYLVASPYAMASPSFVPERKEIWYSDIYSGFYAVRVTNGAWPE